MVSLDINISLLWQIVNFLVLLGALNYLLYRPIRGILKQRAQTMAQLNGEITSRREEGKAKAQELEEQRVQALRQGDVVKEELLAEGRAREREIIEEATREMEEMVAKLRAQITAEVGQAREELKGQIHSFGAELASKILGRSIQ